MTDENSKALLPAGLRDVLPPDAAIEASAVERLMARFGANGYERVKPPMIEFEDALLAGSGATLADQSFRVMDPVSQRMLAVRPDITLQVARIATTRMNHKARPLRLGYAGQVLRIKGSQLRPERQFGQAGIELIGAEGAAADAEVVLTAVEALSSLGISGLSVDLNMPTLVRALCDALGLDAAAKAAVRAALDHKDVVAVEAVGGEAGRLFAALIRAAGPVERALAALTAIDLPAEVVAERDRIAEVVALIRAGAPALTLTLDPVEHRGFEYHRGVSFTIFSAEAGELGRGGRYQAGADERAEPATGATLHMDRVLDALPAQETAARLFVPHGVDWATAAPLRDAGWVTVRGLDAGADIDAEARRLRCSHVLDGAEPRSARSE